MADNSSTTLRLAGETIKTTAGHVFWVSGRGWTRARELRAGDLLHSEVKKDVQVQVVKDGNWHHHSTISDAELLAPPSE